MRMVLAVEDVGTSNEKYKSRIAAHGRKDEDKHNQVHKSTYTKSISLHILLTDASSSRLRIWDTDIP